MCDISMTVVDLALCLGHTVRIFNKFFSPRPPAVSATETFMLHYNNHFAKTAVT